MWIEYYGRQAAAIAEAVRDAERPKVDQWIVMGMPDGVYYHKHLMYNVGLVASRGELVVLFSPWLARLAARVWLATIRRRLVGWCCRWRQ